MVLAFGARITQPNEERKRLQDVVNQGIAVAR